MRNGNEVVWSGEFLRLLGHRAGCAEAVALDSIWPASHVRMDHHNFSFHHR